MGGAPSEPEATGEAYRPIGIFRHRDPGIRVFLPLLPDAGIKRLIKG